MFCKVLKLINGETILGGITEETKTYVDIFRPVKVAISSRDTKSYNVILLKWDPTIDYETPTRIFKTAIVSVSEPTEDFLNSYKEIYEEFDNKQITEDVEEESSINTVDDLSEELEKLMHLMSKNSSNTTFH
jgi:hypothetical protein